MIIKRKLEYPPTTFIRVASTSWAFHPQYNFFHIQDGDLFHILRRGNFNLTTVQDRNFIRPEQICTVLRTGPELCRGCLQQHSRDWEKKELKRSTEVTSNGN